jgi:chromosome partitioning protein
MSRKICVAPSKGGVAKSSTACSIAHGLSIAGKKVLLIDTDDQGQDSFLLEIRPPHGLADVISEKTPVQEAICKARDGLWLLSGGKSLAGVKRDIGRKDFGGEKTLSEALAPLETQFDFVIVDTAPSWDTLTINSMFYCTEVLTPVSL